MNTFDFYQTLVARGVQFRVDGTDLQTVAPPGISLTETERAEIRRHQHVIIALERIPRDKRRPLSTLAPAAEPEIELPWEHTFDYSEGYRLPEPDDLTVDEWRAFRMDIDDGTIEAMWADTCLRRIEAKQIRDKATVHQCNHLVNRLLKERINVS